MLPIEHLRQLCDKSCAAAMAEAMRPHYGTRTEAMVLVLRYLALELEAMFNGEALLFELLHDAQFGIVPVDVANIALYLQRGGTDRNVRHFRQVLGNALLISSLGLQQLPPLVRFGALIDDWHFAAGRLALPALTEKIAGHLAEKAARAQAPQRPRIQLADRNAVARVVRNVTMSYSSLSKYLSCPLCYYYENVLRVPFIKSDALGFGSAVHDALELYFKEMMANAGIFLPKERLLQLFDSALVKFKPSFTVAQYEQRLQQGRLVLANYYDRSILRWPTQVEVEWKTGRFLLDGVPVTGIMDRLDLAGETCVVVDYKTGDPDRSAIRQTSPPNGENPNGGDYWRQMVFYKMLLENAPNGRWKVNAGVFDYLEAGRQTGQYLQLKIPVTASDETTVRQQVREVYRRIQNRDFAEGCGRESCTWCGFVRRYGLGAETQG